LFFSCGHARLIINCPAQLWGASLVVLLQDSSLSWRPSLSLSTGIWVDLNNFCPFRLHSFAPCGSKDKVTSAVSRSFLNYVHLLKGTRLNCVSLADVIWLKRIDLCTKKRFSVVASRREREARAPAPSRVTSADAAN